MKRNVAITALLIFIVSNMVLLQNLPSLTYFHSDETNWIRVSKYSFNTFFIERDFQDEGWRNSFRTFGSQNPQIGKFILGGFLYLSDFRQFDGVVKWETDKSVAWHVEQGIAPNSEERFAARLPVVLLASGTASLVGVLTMLTLTYLLTSRLLVLFGGIITAVLFITHPIIWQHSHQAMPDIPTIFFSTLAITLIILTMLLHQRKLFRQSLLLSLAGAISLGFAISTKMNALLTWGVVLFALATAIIIHWMVSKSWKGKNAQTLSAYLFLQLLIPPAIFLGSNPFLYTNRYVNLEKMFALSQQIANRRSRLPNVSLYTFSEKAGAFAELTLGKFASPFNDNNIINGLVFVIGVAIIGITLTKIRNAQTEAPLAFLTLLIWVFMTGFGVLLWTPLAWSRYYIPWIPAASVFQGIGATYLLSTIVTRLFTK